MQHATECKTACGLSGLVDAREQEILYGKQSLDSRHRAAAGKVCALLELETKSGP
jgi:hypothetical protein